MRTLLVPAILGIVLAGCGSGPQTVGTVEANPGASELRAPDGECVEAWNETVPDAERDAVVETGYAVASVSPWVAMAGAGSEGPRDERRGCGFLFHDYETYLSISGAWSGDRLEWGVPPTIRGDWSREQQASPGLDTAIVGKDGGLTLASARFGDTVPVLPEREDGSFRLVVANTSEALRSLDLTVLIGGSLAVNDAIPAGAERSYSFDLRRGANVLAVRSLGGDAQLVAAVEVTDETWARLEYRFEPGGLADPPSFDLLVWNEPPDGA